MSKIEIDTKERDTLLRAIRTGKKKLKAQFGATAEECRIAAHNLHQRMLLHAQTVFGLGENGAMAFLQKCGVYDAKGNLTPEFGGKPKKPKKKKRK